jgi:glutathione S-transferase
MQETAIHPAIAALMKDQRPALKLVIGNKNYSSWSMRPWVLMRAFGIPFEKSDSARTSRYHQQNRRLFAGR